MADAAIGATIQVALETVLSLANDRIGQVLGFKEELERLSKTAKRIQGFVADADNKKHIPEVLDWLKDLEGEAFKAENVLDEVNYENLRREVKYRSQLKRKVCFFFSFFSTLGFRSRMASKIREINANLERINQDASKFELVTRYQIEAALQVPAPAGAATSRQTDSIVVPNIVGRADDESKIVEMLLSPSDKVVSVIPIVGMGGLGKTTLAKSVYNRSQVDGHFDKKIWVCVAEKIEILELFKFILESLTTKKVEVDRRDTIIQKIQEELGGKRYFLVLDDVWNDEQGLWDDFFSTLEGLNPTKGSWCLATTRLKEAAYTMSRHQKMNVGPYNLGKLSGDECWSIVKGKVVAGEEVPIELEAIKMQILKRCGGLPLLAKLIGGLLLNKGKEEWRFIVKESLLNVDQDDVKQIIKVSFDHLPSTSVKKCFAYCSVFPQDTKLNKDLLIELWMAEGFLRSDPNNKILMEAKGDKHLRILLQSSLLLEEVNKWEPTYYKMHDLVHEFAKSSLNQDLYLPLYPSQGTTKDIIKKNSTSIRTLFLDSSISDDDLTKFECLHVLKLFGKDVNVLPDSIGKLIHLRFLGISDSQITKLPKSLCKLYSLQTLRINGGNLEEGFPKQMSNLISLRHLYYYDTRADFQMPSEMGRLTHLQTLKFFNVGQEDGRGIQELGTLKDLKGSLEIRNIELLNGKEAAEGAKLFEKPNLSELKYLWGNRVRESNNCDENVLEGLQPPQNLRKLEIRNFVGDQFPGWLLNLPTLVELKLIDCKVCRELPALGQLPSLEGLELIGLENVRSIGLSFYGISGGGGQVRKFFPALKYLSLEAMENLAEWMDEDEVRSTTGAAKVDLFPVLEILHIMDCFQVTSAPSHFPSIEKLDIEYNCHISLLEKIVSSITTPSSLELKLVRVTSSRNDGHIKSLNLVKRHNNNNLEEDIVCCLSIDGWVGHVGKVPSEMLERLCHLPSLRDLKLALVYDLTRLACGTSLKSLTLYCCDDLMELPHDLDTFQALRNLTIDGCHEVEKLGEDEGFIFTCLEKLEISYCLGLTSLPGKMLESCASLRILKVSWCDNLVSFPLDLQKTPSLEILNLSYCPKLMIANMPKGFDSLTNLRRLTIGPFSINETTEFDWSKLISSSSSTLAYLEFYGRPHVESLPEQLQDLTSLAELHLRDSGIEALPDWIGNLASLENLGLWGCKKLLYLPCTDAMRRLTKLTSLQVWECPLLKERCNHQSGPNSEWPKISHIRNLQIY